MAQKAINLGRFDRYEQPVESIVHVFYADEDSTTPLNLTGYSARFDWGLVTDASNERNTAAATISDAANGEVTYDWGANDLADVGTHWGVLWVYKASTGRKTSRRFRWHVLDEIYATPPAV